MKGKLLFFIGVYDTLDIFTYELVREFEKLGWETKIIDTNRLGEELPGFLEYIKSGVKAAITFNNLAFNMELTEGKNIWEQIQVPCINILMDHPFCYRQALENAPGNSIVLCTDRNHMRYLQKYHTNIPIVGYLPHGGKESPSQKKALKDRKYDVLYAGNLSKSFAANIIPDLSQYTEFDASELCEEAYKSLIEDPQKTTEQAIEEAIARRKLSYTTEKMREIIADLHFIDLYAVSYYREKAVEGAAKSGAWLQLYGAGWEKCSWIDLPNVHYEGKIPAQEVVAQMADAKIVLSTMTWFKDGTHDRVFNGMLQKAVTLTDTSGYMLEEFKDREELIFFELQQIQTVSDKVRWILEDLERAQAIADHGYEKAYAEHSWRARAIEIEQDLLLQL